MIKHRRRSRGFINRRGRVDLRKFLTQVIVCIILVITVIIIKKANSTVTNKISTMIETSIKQELTIKDVATRTVDGIKYIGSIPRNIAGRFIQDNNQFAFISPIDEGNVISTFGGSYNQLEEKSTFQRGIDYISQGEIQVHAAEDGVITLVSNSNNYGNYIKVNHDETVFSIYSNCTNIYVSEGQKVKKGDLLASVTNEEEADNWFHFELWMDGEIVDPSEYIQLK